MSKAEIARHLGVSRATVSNWAKIVKSTGIRGLRKKKAPGSEAKLSNVQKEKLKRKLDRGALACGFPTDRWTLERVRQLIEKEFKVPQEFAHYKRPERLRDFYKLFYHQLAEAGF